MRRNLKNSRPGRAAPGGGRGASCHGEKPCSPGGRPSDESPLGRERRLIFGRNCLCEVLEHCPERIKEVFVVRKQGRVEPDYQRIVDELDKRNLAVRFLSKEELSMLTGSEAHQSFAASLSPKPQPVWRSVEDDLAGKENSLVLVLDSIYDPQNLGSILRAAECFSVDAVIWSRNRGTGVTPLANKASAGAAELSCTIEVSNIADILKKLKARGFWIVACEARDNAADVVTFDFPPKTALVLGSEGEGLHQLASRLADFHVRIPLYGRIDSLNVGQAAAVMLHCYRRKFGKDGIKMQGAFSA